MGVDFSHCDAQWSYAGFNKFRRRLAQEIGMNLEDMEGFRGSESWKWWDDDILPLLDHSDCDGILTPDECRKVAPRLRELVSNWKEEDDKDKRGALELAEGMDAAAGSNEALVFR